MLSVFIFGKGIIIGLAAAIPLGPVGVLTLRRALCWGRPAAIATGLGAASIDGFYALLAATGVGWLSAKLLQYRDSLHLYGGVLVILLGLWVFFRQLPREPEENQNGRLLSGYTTGLLITASNPLLIIYLSGMFAAAGLGSVVAKQPLLGILAVLGVFCGSAMWFSFLSILAARWRQRLMGDGLIWVNRITGLLLVALGALVLFGQ